ncbi:hypothetical protein [Pseudomonas sp. CGJS7]|uniref:hypothetical protein n=1 Tax=Pseudomonas sp. CGJS7 TaxID=3109348 RepID=UPI003009B836
MESFIFGFAFYGGFFVLAAGLAWVGYLKRKRLPGFNRWYWGALLATGLGALTTYAAHQLALAMRGAITG